MGKTSLHPRNRHQGHYDFEKLIQACPELSPFVSLNPYKKLSIDFADPKAVKTLNRALLLHFYGVSHWEIPDQYLCPPIPGRADYLHNVADLLGSSNEGVIPRGDSVRALDIGVGANCIYPLIGHGEYGWRFVGADIDPIALASAKRIVESNQNLSQVIELRRQKSPLNLFEGIFQTEDRFDFTACNPPFHASLEEARAGSRRKWKNLGHGSAAGKRKGQKPLLNFGGQGAELWCPGGELAFVRRMIQESARFAGNVFWFSTLVSKESHLPGVSGALRKVKVTECRTLEMAQGQKKSRIVAWTFLSPEQQQVWRIKRWKRP